MGNNNLKDLLSQLASLESKIDMYETELSRLNDLLVHIGFPEGIQTLKMTMQELIAEQNLQMDESESKRPALD